VSLCETGTRTVSRPPASGRGVRRTVPSTAIGEVGATRDVSSYVHGTMLSGAVSRPSTASATILYEPTTKSKLPIIPASAARKPISSRPVYVCDVTSIPARSHFEPLQRLANQ
jgi:hypothetical protein